ncbi:MAG: hypothetical protein DCC65_10585 [Planctomycetota bacterium]|nr:MAG: hypothetical protein DCC65_10585 [Planctomycetota bacterium]
MARSSGRKRSVSEAYRLRDTPERLASILSNGMTVIVQHHDAAPVVAVRGYIVAGSAFEGRLAGSGLTHLLEHVVTGGATRRRDEAAIMALGDSIGGLNNAYTSVDHMCYHVTAESRHLAEALELVADWIVRPTLSRQVFEREMGVVRREWESDRDDPQTLLDELLYETVYRKHPLGHPVIGRAESLERLSYEDVVEYHRRTHVPSGCVLVIAGQVDIEAGLKAAVQAFDGFEGPAARTPPLPDPPPIHSPVCAKRQVKTDSASMVLAWLTVREGAPDDVPLDLLASLMTEGDSARLVSDLRWNSGIVFDIAGTHESFWHSPGTIRFSAQLKPEKLDEVEARIIAALEELPRRPITDHELERIRRQNVIAVETGRLTAESHAAQIGLDYLATANPDYSDAYLAAVRAASPEDICRAAQVHASAQARALVAVTPQRRARSRARTGGAGAAPACTRFVLENGLRCIVRPVPRAAFVAVSATFMGGVRDETDETSGLFNLLAEVMPRGTARFSAETIAAEFERRGSGLRTGSGPDTLGLEFMALAGDFGPLLEIMADVIVSPGLAPEQLEIIRPSVLDAISRIDEDWHAEMGRLARRCYFVRSPYRHTTLGTAESVARLKAADLRAAHDAFIHAGGVVSIAGAVEPDGVRQLLAESFGGLASPRLPQRAAATEPVGDAPPAEDRLFVKTVADDRHTAAIFVGYPGCSLVDTEARAPLAVFGTLLAGYALSGGRLFAALRGGQKNMVYEVSGAHFAGLMPGFFAVTAACEPQCVSDVHAIILREVRELLDGRVGDDELERARNMVLMAELEQLQTVSDFARRDAFDEICGLGIGDAEAFLDEVRRADRTHIIDTARRFLTHATTVIITPDPQELHLGIEPRAVDF